MLPLTYQRPDDSGRLLLIVEARSSRLGGTIESAMFEGQRDQRLDIGPRPRERSAVSAIRLSLKPWLDGAELVKAVDGTERDALTFLSAQTGLSGERIMRLAVAERLQAVSGVAADAFHGESDEPA